MAKLVLLSGIILILMNEKISGGAYKRLISGGGYKRLKKVIVSPDK